MGKRKGKSRRNRRQYTPEYKAEAVRLWQESGRTCKEIADELGLAVSTLSGWAKRLGARRPEVVDTALSPEQEVKRLRRRVHDLEMEREILKKAAAFFAKESE